MDKNLRKELHYKDRAVKTTLMMLLLMIISTPTSFGQSTRDLDTRNGFRHFTLGTTPAENRNIVRDVYMTNVANTPGYTIYEYIGESITSIGMIGVQSVSLHFFRNRLESVSTLLSWGFTEYQFEDLLQSLESLYGRAIPIRRTSNIVQGASWSGENVQLQLVRMHSRTGGRVFGVIEIRDLNLQRERTRNMF